jgi:hypothetical protein
MYIVGWCVLQIRKLFILELLEKALGRLFDGQKVIVDRAATHVKSSYVFDHG